MKLFIALITIFQSKTHSLYSLFSDKKALSIFSLWNWCTKKLSVIELHTTDNVFSRTNI